MLRSPKSIVAAIDGWINGDDDESAWSFGDDITAGLHSTFALWESARRGGWSYSDWVRTPLSMLVKLRVIETVHDTLMYKSQKDADWSKMTATQRELLRWIDTWPTD